MQVRVGWTGETEPNQWNKADVTVDEGDLDRLLAEAGVPGGLGGKLPTRLVFQLLQNEAEMLLMTRLMGQGYPAEKARARFEMVDGVNKNIMAEIKKQLAAG